MRLITSPNVIFIQNFVVVSKVIKDTFTEEKIVKFRVIFKFITVSYTTLNIFILSRNMY